VDIRPGLGEAIALPPVVEVQLIGIIQEALANVRKHAHARRVLVSLACDGGLAEASIDDDGVGFDLAAVAWEGRESFGIETMRERAEAVGGKLTLTSRPGQGTSVAVALPVDSSAGRHP